MVGATDEDIGSSSAKTVDEALVPFGSEKEKANQVYNPDGKLSGLALGTLIARDRMMLEPARFVARVFSAAGQPAYYYRFSYVADSLRKENESVPGHPKGGAQHASEIPYVFNTVAAKYGPKLTGKEIKVAEAANAYWANFAKTGNPNGPGLPQWLGYAPANEELMDFTSAGRPEANPDPLQARLDLTASLAGAHESK
jgi:para-nitrobenzyl esterase